MGTVTNGYLRNSLPWRHNSKLHMRLGASVIRINPVVIGAGGTLPLFQGAFAEDTIDRIIGCALLLNGVGSGAKISITELTSGYSIPIHAATMLGNYWLNLETPVNYANLVLTSDTAITAAMGAQIELYNFEIQPFQFGHS